MVIAWPGQGEVQGALAPFPGVANVLGDRMEFSQAKAGELLSAYGERRYSHLCSRRILLENRAWDIGHDDPTLPGLEIIP